MGIQLTQIRISNYRSIENCEISFENMNLIIGQNNVGKSNVLRAISIALNSSSNVSEKDIHVEKDEELSATKEAIIDILIRPTDNSGNTIDVFSPFWVSTFTTDWISTDLDGSSFVGIRTTVFYDVSFGQYRTKKAPIQQWNSSIEDAVCGRRRPFTQDMQLYITCFYLDAHRDISEDINNKKSYFGRATSGINLPEELVAELEAKLNDINTIVVSNTPALDSTQKMISAVGSVIGDKTELHIEPISRKINDLQRGMDVKISGTNSAILSISEQGMGTRSWVSFLTLGAYITNLTKQINEEDPDAEFYSLLALEEPEAHLHSHAQKRLFDQIMQFPGQKIISTHSANVLAQAPVESLIHLYKCNAKTENHRMQKQAYSIEEINTIQREITRTRGDLLFSTAIILAEGITEESAFPIFFKEQFGQDPFSMGISIVGVGGQRYKPFLRLLKDFDIPWFIFSDGESSTLNTVKKAVANAYGSDSQEIDNNVVFLDQGDYYEKHLIKSGYLEEMICAINKYEKEIRKELYPEDAARDPREYIERYIEDNHGKNGHDYSGEQGREQAILDIIKKNGNKAKYAIPVAKEIVSGTTRPKIPPKIEELFNKMNAIMHIKEGEELGDQII